MPGWLRVVRRFGLERAWLAGMLLAVACFGWAARCRAGRWRLCRDLRAVGRGAGRRLVFAWRLLALLIERSGAQGTNDGAYLGWWNLATKLNLALAAGPRRCRCCNGWATCRAARIRWHCNAWHGFMRCCLARQADGGLVAASPVDRLQTHPRSDTMNTRRHALLTCSRARRAHRLRQPPGDRLRPAAPKLELDRYFNGRIRAHGIFKKRGAVVRRFTVVMDCHWEGKPGRAGRGVSAIPTAAPSGASGA